MGSWDFEYLGEFEYGEPIYPWVTEWCEDQPTFSIEQAREILELNRLFELPDSRLNS